MFILVSNSLSLTYVCTYIYCIYSIYILYVKYIIIAILLYEYVLIIHCICIGEYFKFNISTAISLLIVVCLIGGGVLMSYIHKREVLPY
jgi:hypothetical protein